MPTKLHFDIEADLPRRQVHLHQDRPAREVLSLRNARRQAESDLLPTENGTYIIPKVMHSGYVELGKKRMDFTRKG